MGTGCVADLPHFSGLFGSHGVGKTTLMTYHAVRHLQSCPWQPLISCVPVVTDKPNTLFLTFSPGDMIAASLVLSSWLFSDEAKAIAEFWRVGQEAKRRKAARGKVRFRPWLPDTWDLRDEEIVINGFDRFALEAVVSARFDRLQQEYRDTAQAIDWDDREAINDMLMAWNSLVMQNKLGQRVEDFRALAAEYKASDRYNIASHCHGNFRFRFQNPYLTAMCLLDESGVSMGINDNRTLRESAVYPWLTHARRLGCQVVMTGHSASNVWVQMRQVISRFTYLRAIKVRGGRVVFSAHYQNQEDMEARRDRAGWGLHWVPVDLLGRTSTYYNVLSW
jgi:hypothetical protein